MTWWKWILAPFVGIIVCGLIAGLVYILGGTIIFLLSLWLGHPSTGTSYMGIGLCGSVFLLFFTGIGCYLLRD